MQVPLQLVWPNGQDGGETTQESLWQKVPPGQTLPQAPQLDGSDVSCVQFVPQRVPEQAGTAHVPLWQVVPEPHALPQAPQLSTSLMRFTHALPQTLSEVSVQVQMPFEHRWSGWTLAVD